MIQYNVDESPIQIKVTELTQGTLSVALFTNG